MKKYFNIFRFTALIMMISCTKVQTADDSFIFSKKLRNSQVGIKIVNLTKDKVLLEKGSNYLLTPASNMKLLTTAASLEVLGADYTFDTNLAYDGEIKDGVLNGNLYILGSGDPTLGSRYFKEKNVSKLSFLNDWVRWTKKQGIKKILGSVIVDTSHYKPFPNSISTWEWKDMSYDYGAPPHSVNLLDNTVIVSIKNEKEVNIYPKTSAIKVENNLRSNSHTYVQVVAPPYSNYLSVNGSISDGHSEQTVMPNPPLVLGDLLSVKLKEAGIENRGAQVDISVVKDGLNVYYTHSSPKLLDIIALTNKKSINLFAEVLKLETELALKELGYNSIESYWESKLNLGDLQVYDGSGLSRYNALSPNTIIDLLDYMEERETYEVYYDSLAIAGVDSTYKRFKNEMFINNLRGKSGTLTGIKAYSGYYNNEEGELLAYSIILNHHTLKSGEITRCIEEILLEYY